MRPRVFPAEDLVELPGVAEDDLASMRPRVFPAEDRTTDDAPIPLERGFNEAAGIPRGRLKNSRGDSLTLTWLQ